MTKYKCKNCGLPITKEEFVKYDGQCHSCFADQIKEMHKEAHRNCEAIKKN